MPSSADKIERGRLKTNMADCAERFQTTFSQRYGDRCVGAVRK
ncbi:hypothetical protein [Neisseria sicca]|nr:hypothetical protein [Neisseria sicca]